MPNKFGVLGSALVATRGVQIIALIPLIGITAHLTAYLISLRDRFDANASPVWHLTLFALTLSCLAMLYSVLSLLLLLDDSLPLLGTMAADLGLLIPVIVVVALMDKYGSLSSITCNRDVGSAENASDLAEALGGAFQQWSSGDKLPFSVLLADKGHCKETKSVWALYISLLVLFFISAVMAAFVWNRQRKGRLPLKGEA